MLNLLWADAVRSHLKTPALARTLWRRRALLRANGCALTSLSKFADSYCYARGTMKFECPKSYGKPYGLTRAQAPARLLSRARTGGNGEPRGAAGGLRFMRKGADVLLYQRTYTETRVF